MRQCDRATERPTRTGWAAVIRPGLLLAALFLGLAAVAGSLEAADAGGDTAAGTQRLWGRWLRPDGGYVLELREAPSGQGVEALYFNPRPIHVGRAEFREEGGAVSVFVELRDVNYPGSTYTLLYDPRTDRLGGTYFQAVQRATYDVEFVRLR